MKLITAARLPTRLVMPCLVTAAFLLNPPPAGAAIDGPCDGTVVIDGITYTEDNDTADNPIVVPAGAGLVASWEGRTDTPITDHSGELGIVIGPGVIRVARWSGENADRKTASSGDHSIDEARALLPVSVVGIYQLRGTHTGDGGTCTGSVMVDIEGNPLSTPIGAVAGVGTLLALGGMMVSARGRGGAV